MFSAILGFSVLLFAFAAPGLIIWSAGKTLGDWADRSKAEFEKNPATSFTDKVVRTLKA